MLPISSDSVTGHAVQKVVNIEPATLQALESQDENVNVRKKLVSCHTYLWRSPETDEGVKVVSEPARSSKLIEELDALHR